MFTAFLHPPHTPVHWLMLPAAPKQQQPDPVVACLAQLFQQPSSTAQLSERTHLMAEDNHLSFVAQQKCAVHHQRYGWKLRTINLFE